LNASSPAAANLNVASMRSWREIFLRKAA